MGKRKATTARVTSVVTAEEGAHVVIAFDLVSGTGQVVVQDTMTVGVTADAENIAAQLAHRAAAYDALLALNGQSFGGDADGNDG